MTQYNRVNVKLSTSQLNKLKSAIKSENDVVIRLSLNMIGDSNDKGNFPHELLLTNRHISSICKAFANIKLIYIYLILNFQKLSYQKSYSQEDF